MGAVKKGVIPRNGPLVKKCTRVISVIQDHISRITWRNRADVPMCAELLPGPGLFIENNYCLILIGSQHPRLIATYSVISSFKMLTCVHCLIWATSLNLDGEFESWSMKFLINRSISYKQQVSFIPNILLLRPSQDYQKFTYLTVLNFQQICSE